MAKLLKLRRGTTTQHDTFTGAEGEVTVDLNKDVLVVHDGQTQAGHPLAAEDMSNVSSTDIVSRITNSALAGVKVQPNFGSQNVETTGTLASGNHTVTGNISVSGTVDGRDLATDGSKLDNIQAGATDDQTATEILTAIKTVDGANSGLDADVLDGQHGSYYQNASNLNAGTINDARLPATISSDITGNAASADTVDVASFQSNQTMYPTFVDNNAAARNVYVDGALSYNPSSNILTAGTFSGSHSGNGASLTSLNASNISSGTISASRIPTLNQNTTGSSGSCTGNAATATSATNADTVDNLHASSFIRSDADDSSTGKLTIANTSNEKIILSGTNEPYIRFQEGTTNKAYIQWHSNGTFYFVNQESGEQLLLGSGSNGLQYYVDGSTKTVWHSGNDGSGSGLDADTVDGLDVHTGRNNGANKLVRTDGNGYLLTGHINADVNDTGTGADIARFYCSEDSYIRYIDKASMRSVMNTPARSSAYAGRESYSSNTNYWVGSCGHGSYNLDTTLWDYGSCFWDAWSDPSGEPSGSSSHWTGMQAMHYTDGTNRYGFRFACGTGNPAYLYVQGRWGTTTNGWYKLWNEANDGSGSGLDADKLDGVEGSSYMSKTGSHWNANSWLECNTTHGLYWPNNYSYHVYLNSQYLHIRNNSTSNGLYMSTNNGTLRGYLYVNSSNNIGFLNNSGSWIVQCDSSGNATFTGNVTAYSDARLKTNVNTIDNALDIVDQLRGVSFDWIESGKHSIGVIAQEIEEVLPEVVLTQQVSDVENPEEREVKSVDYGKIVGVLINAIKELRAEVEELKGGK